MKMAKIKLQDVRNVVSIGKEVLPLMEPTLKKYGSIAAEQVGQKAKQAGEAFGGVRASVAEKVQQRKDAKYSKKTADEARKRAVESSIPPIPAEEFFKSFEANVTDSDDLKNGYMAIPGCYAILTMKSARENDLSKYKDVYVGCSNAIGFDVYSQLRGFGNVDVYADYKFEAPMKVLVYPCDEEQIEARFNSLVNDLQSITSYNKWEALAVASATDR